MCVLRSFAGLRTGSRDFPPLPLRNCGEGWFQTVTKCRLRLVFLGFTVINPGGPQLCFCQAIGPGATLSWPNDAVSAVFPTFPPLTSTTLSLLQLRSDGRGKLCNGTQPRRVPRPALACQAPPRPVCVCARPISCTSRRRSAQSSVCVCVCVTHTHTNTHARTHTHTNTRAH